MKTELKNEYLMSTGRRSRQGIMAEIISLTQNPAKITRIMQLASLNYSQQKEILKFMIERHLIEKKKIPKEPNRIMQTYQATKKGLAFLKIYCSLLELLQEKENTEQKNSKKNSKIYLRSFKEIPSPRASFSRNNG